MDTFALRGIMREELAGRRLSSAPGDYAFMRDSDENVLYGVTGAANLYAELGFDFGSFADREAWCERINSFQTADGTFDCVSGPEHGAAMAILALNILGGRPARPVRHLAPLNPTELEAWLDDMDWSGSTHKEFCSAVSPILASGFYDTAWRETMCANVGGRLDPAHPMQVWCPPGDVPAWRVVSCIYHVVSGYDQAFVPYPKPRLIWDRLTALEYERKRNDQQRTCCTDFDYAWIVNRLCRQLPEYHQEAHRRYNATLDKMIEEWHDDRERMLSASTHDLYCECIGWALYQRLLPERFTGPGLLDTLNAPWLYRLPDPDWVA
jgi:hypothetical protein